MERLDDPSKRRGDFLDQAIDDMETEKFLTVDFILQLMFGILFASFESMSTTLTLTFKFLSENPRVVEELAVCVHSPIIKLSFLSFQIKNATLFTPARTNCFIRLSTTQL